MTMAVLRVLAASIPIPNESWKPILRFVVDGIKQQDVFLQDVNGAQELSGTVVECPVGSMISFQLGIRKSSSISHMGSHTHRITMDQDYLTVASWEQEGKQIQTTAGRQHVLMVSVGVQDSTRVCGSCRTLGKWKHEDIEGQTPLFVTEGISVVPVALEEHESDDLEFKLLNGTGGEVEWEAPPFRNKRVAALPDTEDAVICSTWSQEAVHVTELPRAPLTEKKKSSAPPEIVPDWPVRKSHSLPGVTAADCSPNITFSSRPAADDVTFSKPDCSAPAILDLAGGDAGEVAVHAEESFVDISWVFQEAETPLTKGKTSWPSLVNRIRRILLVFKCCRGNRSSEHKHSC